MNEIRYKRILLVQGIFLTILAILSYFLAKNSASPTKYLFVWFSSIILNIIYIKRYALPTKSLLEKIKTSTSQEDPSWSFIEDSINQKDDAFNKQKAEFEQENIKYNLLLDSLQDPVCILNKDLVVIYANQAFRIQFDLIDKTLPIALIEFTRNLEFQEFLENAVKVELTSKKSYFCFSQLHDSQKSYFDLKVFPVDNVNNYLCLLHDVSERKLADQMREDFVSNFSHEVRTPLTILSGQMQNLKTALSLEADFTERYSAYFEKIENNSRRLINLFNDLLRLSTVESTKDIVKEEIDIEEMLEFLTQDLLINYPDKKIHFEISLKQKKFYVDYNLFEQILINLIDNALKYIKQTGLISITSYHQDNWDHLVITDNGVGIPEDQIHRIFERFFRIDPSRSSETQGTGLGLSIVKHIIQKHDGKIKVQSLGESGSSFSLSFPSQEVLSSN